MHQDLGQLQLYVNYYDRERRTEGDNPTLGLILCADKNDAVVKYTLGPEQEQKIFASRYKLHLPTDPAPLEALLQRFGRVNRKGRLESADVAVMTKIPPNFPVYKTALIDGALNCLASSDGKMVDESKVQTWLDQIYSGEDGKRWRREVSQARHDFRDVLDTLSVFDSSPEWGRRFDELFDGSEVIPKSLEAEYLEWLARDPLLASSLLVPVTSRQAGWLTSQGRLRSISDGLRVADAAYDVEIGLQLSKIAPDDV
jgi:hypothetical protein